MGRRKKTSKPAVQEPQQAEDFFSMEVEGPNKELGEALSNEQFPVPCTISAIGAASSGGALGFVFGFGQQLLKHKGKGRWKACRSEGVTGAKSFAACTGVYSLASCVAQRLRQRQDAWNGAIGGCASGLVLGWGGGPQSVISSCLIAGVLSYFVSANEVNAQERPRRHEQGLPALRMHSQQQRCTAGICRVRPTSSHPCNQSQLQFVSTPTLCISCHTDPLVAHLAAPWLHLWTSISNVSSTRQSDCCVPVSGLWLLHPPLFKHSALCNNTILLEVLSIATETGPHVSSISHLLQL